MNPYNYLPEQSQGQPILRPVELDKQTPTDTSFNSGLENTKMSSFILRSADTPAIPETDSQLEIFEEVEKSAHKTLTSVVGLGTLAVCPLIEQPDGAQEVNLLDRVDKRSKKLAQKLSTAALSTAMLSAWTFELGPWNETVRANVGFDVFNGSYDALKTGAAVFATTVPIEFIPAALVAIGLSRENMPGRGAMKWMHQKLGAGTSSDRDRTKFDFAKDASLALGVGVAAVVAKRFFTEKMTLKQGLITSAVLAPLTAFFSGGVGWATAYGILHAEGTKFESAAKFLKENGTDAKFWLAVFGALQVGSLVGQNIKQRREVKSAQTA